MIHDLLRTACVIAVMAVACSLLIETRFHLAAIASAQRQTCQPPTVTPPPSPGEGGLRAVGRAVLDLADAGLGVIR